MTTSKANQFVVSTEIECQNYLNPEGGQEEALRAVSKFLARLPKEIPCLSDGHGYFTPYGRFYIDCGHLEMAAAECDDPYVLALILERLQLLCRRVIGNLAGRHRHLRLANNNHSGLLRRGGVTWGSHENYLVEKPPSEFTGFVLPFLATRFYGGAGGVQAESGDPERAGRDHQAAGNYIASVRAEFIHHETGGSTTDSRALHSTCRNEHHMGSKRGRYRYHLILGDGKRSHFNIALQFGATALALKAIQNDDGFLAERLRQFDHMPKNNSWVESLHELNVLARPGGLLRVDERALLIQRTYLEAARRFAAKHEGLPSWVDRCLEDWGRTLTAAVEMDRAWLAAHLDAFAKYELFTSYLGDKGADWVAARDDKALLSELTLLDHSWHDFIAPDSYFERAAAGGLMDHRVGDCIAPGEEPEPYIPEVTTRARTRARFIVENQGNNALVMDWSGVYDGAEGRSSSLDDPFGEEYGPWQELEGDLPPRLEILGRLRRLRRQRR